MITRHSRYLATILLGLAGVAGSARGAVLEVAPVTIELTPGVMAAAITITSHDSTPVFVQVRGFTWAQTGNTDALVPTDAIAVAPPIFSLPGGTPQVVRVVLRAPAIDKESAYRLLVDEIPAKTNHTGVQFALRLSIPLFVEPAADIAPRLQAHLEKTATGDVALVIENSGTRRTRLLDLALATEGGGAIKFASPPNPYLLPGSVRRWTLQNGASTVPPGATIRVTAKTENGPLLIHAGYSP